MASTGAYLEDCFTFLLGFRLRRTALSRSGGLTLERDGMPLHDTVGVNCKGVTT